MRRTFALAVTLLLASSSLAFQNDTAKGAIEGVVLNDLDGSPVAGAQVTLTVFIGDTVNFDLHAFGIETVTTGLDGHFSFKNVNPSPYRILVSANGMVEQEYGQRTAFGVGRPVYVVSGQTLKDINVRLQSTGVVTGRIVDEAGQPATGVPVALLHARYSRSGRSLELAGTATANDRGQYRIYGIAPGHYYLLAGTEPGQVRPQVRTRNSNQSRVENYGLKYYPDATDDGQAMTVEVKSAAELTVDMRVKKQQDYHVRGRVVDANTGQPPPGIVISSMFRTLDGINMNAVLGSDYKSETGDFDIPNVLPGSYTLQARSPAPGGTLITVLPTLESLMAAGARAPFGLASVTVLDKDVVDLSIVISSGTAVPARLLVEGQPVMDLDHFSAVVSLVPEQSRDFMGPSPIKGSEFAPDGSFSFSNIHDDEYRVSVNGLVPGFYVRSIKYAGADVLGKTAHLGTNRPGIVEITVQRGTGTLTGSVTDSRNEVVPGIQVAVVPDQRNRVERYRSVLARQDGRFTILNLQPGSYKVFSWEEVEEGAHFDPEFISRHEQQGRSVVISEDSETDIEVKMIPAAGR